MATSDRTILVTGATGHQGSAVAHHLLKRGNFQVRALVRDKHKPAAQSLKRLGAELFVGDLDQQASLEHALQGVYGVFSMQGLNDGIAAFTRVLGKNVAYQQIPFAAFEQQAGEEMTTMYRWFENVGYGADLAQLKHDFPAPTDFDSYLREHDWVKQAA